MVEVISKSETTVNRAIRELKDNNLLDEKESDKNGSWVIKVKKKRYINIWWGLLAIKI